MRKYASFCIILVLLVTAVIPVHAAFAVYQLPELGMSISIPANYDVFTRDMAANDPLFSAYGFTPAELMEDFSASNIYMDAISSDGSDAIIITMTENAMSDFNTLSDTVLRTLATGLEDEFVNYGITVTESDVYHHSQLTFLRLAYHDLAETTYIVQYYTIYDSKAVNVNLYSHTGAITSAQKNTILSVVDSIELDSYTPPVTTVETTPAFEYTDPDTGATFTVPANWKNDPLSKEREYIDVKFASTEEVGLVMTYGSTDLWSQLPASERIGLQRADFDNSVLSEADLVDIFGTFTSVEEVTYNGKNYYMAELTEKAEAGGVSLTINMTNLIRIENGWVYWFQFGGKTNHALFADFEQLICSVSYPATDAPTAATAEDPTADTATGGFSRWILVGILVIVIGAVLAAVLIHKNKARYRSETAFPTPQGSAGGCIYCRNCGMRLPADSVFCHQCGTKV